MKENEALSEGGAGGILAGFLPGLFGFEDGRVGAGEEMGGVVGGEDGFTGGVGVGAESRVAVDGIVLAVVKDEDAHRREDGGWANLGEAGVEMTGSAGKDFDGGVGCRVFDGRPMEEVGRGGEVEGAFAPEHPELAFDLCGYEVRGVAGVCNECGYDAAGFVLEGAVAAAGGGEEGGALLPPVKEIGRGSDADGVGLAVVLGVGEDVGAVRGFNKTWIFDAAGPLAGFLGVVRGEEDGFGKAGEVEAVGGGGEAEAGGVAADLHGAGVIFGAIEDEDFAVANNGGGVEGVEGFPVDGLVGDGVGEGGGGLRREDRGGERSGEGA